MDKKEFLIYCLLYAIDLDVNFRKQNLVKIAESYDAVTFVKMYNAIQQHDEKTRREVVEYNKVKHSLTDEEVRMFVEEHLRGLL